MVELAVVGVAALLVLGFVFGAVVCLVCVCAVANWRQWRKKKRRYSVAARGDSEYYYRYLGLCMRRRKRKKGWLVLYYCNRRENQEGTGNMRLSSPRHF